MKMFKRVLAALAAVCVTVTASGSIPVAADPNESIVIDGVDTGVLRSCATVGTGTSMNSSWENVPYEYDPDDEDTEDAYACALSIVDFLIDEVDNLDINPNTTLPQKLRNELFSGMVNLASPYEVFLNNIYLTTPALAALSPIDGDPATGLDSCELTDYMLLIRCRDDDGGGILLRDENGNALLDWNNDPIYVPLSGLLSSQGGGTMYGSMFLQTPYNYYNVPFDIYVEHHEQVHAQQWSQWGWDFGLMYFGEAAGAQASADYYFWAWGRIDNVKVPGRCFNAFERAAGLADGFYSQRPVSKGGPVPDGRAYPEGWTDVDVIDPEWCPSTW